MTIRLSSVAGILFATLAPVMPLFAGPITIDFENLRTASALAFSVGPMYSDRGFVLTSVPLIQGEHNEFDYFGTLSNEFYGATALLNCCGLNTTVLTRTDGGTFNLLSIDLIEIRGFNSDGTQADVGPGHVMFVGTKRTGATVSYAATFLQFPTASEIDFAGFTDLLSVWWQQGPGSFDGAQHQFDNIRVQSVPEPATLFLLGIGCVGAVAFRRRVQPNGVSGMEAARLGDWRTH